MAWLRTRWKWPRNNSQYCDLYGDEPRVLPRRHGSMVNKISPGFCQQLLGSHRCLSPRGEFNRVDGAAAIFECPLWFRSRNTVSIRRADVSRPRIGAMRSRVLSITSARDIGLRGVPRTAATRSERRVPSARSMLTMVTRTGRSLESPSSRTRYEV